MVVNKEPVHDKVRYSIMSGYLFTKKHDGRNESNNLCKVRKDRKVVAM